MARRIAVIAFAAGVAVAASTASALVAPAAGPAAVGTAIETAIEQAVEPEVGIRIELVDEEYAFEPDASLHLVYRLSGDLNSLDLDPDVPAEVPTTTEVPATTEVPTTVAAVDPITVDTPTVDPTTLETAAPATTPPATTPPVTTVAPPVVEPPPLLPLFIRVTNYPPLGAAATARAIDDLIGGAVDRDGFGDAIDGIQIDDARPLITYDADGSALLTVEVPTDVLVDSVEERLKFETPGLYPIRTELLAGPDDSPLVVATHGTVVQRLPGPGDIAPAPAPIALSVVTAVHPAGTAAGDAATAATEFDDAVDLAAAITAPVTLDVPPPIVDAAASSPSGEQRLAESLADDEFVAVPAVPLDASSAVEVDRADEFARLLSAGEDMLTGAVPTTPSRRNAWVVLDPLSGAGAQELRDLGFRFLVMTQDMYRGTVDTGSADTGLPETDLFTTVALPDGGTLPLIVIDSLSDELTTASADEILTSATTVEWAVGSITSMLVDDLGQERLERSRILSTPDLRAPDARLIGGLESIAATTPSIGFVSASTLTGTTDVQTERGEPVVVSLPATAGPPLAARVQLIDSTALSAASAGSMLPADDPRPDQWAAELNALLSTGVDDDEAAAVAAQIQAEADAIRGAVVPPAPFKFTLTGRSGDIEVQVGNTSAEPLDVVLRFSSPKLSFPDSTPPPDDPDASDVGDHAVTLRPNDETSVIVPVRAKANGTSPITVEVLTPAGEVIGDPITITARVTAFTGLGQVLTGGFILVLLTWWFAHWRSRRRADLESGRDRHPSAVV